MEEETKDLTASENAEQEQEPKTAKNIVTIEEAGPCKKKVIIEIPEETIKDAVNEQYRELGRDAVVPGFRKGRAPRRLLEKRFGKETNEQIKIKLLADGSEAAVKDHDLDILGDPDIDFDKIELPATGSLKYEFEIEVRPDFELPALEGIPVTRTKLEVADEQIDREIEQLCRWSGVWTPRDEGAAAELDDQVIADVVLRPELTEEEKAQQAKQAEEGEADEETTVIEAESKLDNTEIHVRANGFAGPIPIEKLDKLLVGAKAGQKKETSVEVPKTYVREEYRGRKVDVEIVIKDIKYLKPAEMDESFFQRYQVDGADDLRERVRDNLQNQLESRVRTEMSEQINVYLVDNTQFDLPVDVVARQAGALLQRQYVNLLSRGLSRQQIEEQMEQLRASTEDEAKEQLKAFFIMDKVADQLAIEVTEEEINGHIAQVAIQRNQRPEKMKEQMERDGSLAQFRVEVRHDKCVNKLLESADISEKAADKTPEKAPKKTVKKAKKKKVAKNSAKPKADKQDQ